MVAFELRLKGNEDPAMRLAKDEASQTEGTARARILRQEPRGSQWAAGVREGWKQRQEQLVQGLRGQGQAVRLHSMRWEAIRSVGQRVSTISHVLESIILAVVRQVE